MLQAARLQRVREKALQGTALCVTGQPQLPIALELARPVFRREFERARGRLLQEALQTYPGSYLVSLAAIPVDQGVFVGNQSYRSGLALQGGQGRQGRGVAFAEGE